MVVKQWAPLDVQKDLKNHLGGLKSHVPRLLSKKADFIEERIKEDSERQMQMAASSNQFSTTIKLKPAFFPKFTASMIKS